MNQANYKDFLLWVLRLRKCYKVEGSSMEPLLKSGDRVLIKREKAYAEGDIVVTQHPFKRSVRLIKKVDKVADGRAFLMGLNREASTDSRVFSSIPVNQIIGRATSRLKS